MFLVIVNGAGASGKSSFEKFLCDYAKNLGIKTRITSMVNYTKEVAKTLGWDGGKTDADRKFLCDLKKCLSDWRDIPFQVVEGDIIVAERDGVDILFIDAREPEDIDRLVMCSPNPCTILITRNETRDKVYGNYADDGVLNYNYDYIIENNGTLEDLKESAITFYEELTSTGELVISDE